MPSFDTPARPSMAIGSKLCTNHDVSPATFEPQHFTVASLSNAHV